jgi:hypothetical protein
MGFGTFRLPNARAFSTYLNGRFYDPVYYAPKDTQVMNSVEPVLDNPDEFVPLPAVGGVGQTKWSSYCFSPAAMYNPHVFGANSTGSGYYNSPWLLKSGFRSPAMSQAIYGDLKTHIIEHNWLQNRKRPCHPFIASGPYDGCTPYFFNHAFNSAPVSLFYDGHIEVAGQGDAIESNLRVSIQNGNGNPSNHGLWSMNTPLGPSPMAGGSYGENMEGPSASGYFMNLAQDWTSTSYHILTIDGIKGRDLTPK